MGQEDSVLKGEKWDLSKFNVDSYREDTVSPAEYPDGAMMLLNKDGEEATFFTIGFVTDLKPPPPRERA